MTSPVVVGIDGSEESCRAAALGHAIAKTWNSPLHLLTVARNTALEVAAVRADLDLAGVDEAWRQCVAAEAREALGNTLPPEVIEGALECRTGRVEHVLTEFALEVGAGLVVLGGHPHTAPSRWFHRGTAQLLIRKSPTPVLVTGPPPFEAEVRRVLLALDLSGTASRVITFGRELSKTFDVALEAIHVVDEAPLSFESPLQITVEALRDAHQRRAEEDLQPLLPAGVAVRLLMGPVREEIAAAAAAIAGTVVVVGSHGLGVVNRWVLGSTTEWLLDHLPSAVAVVPAQFPSST